MNKLADQLEANKIATRINVLTFMTCPKVLTDIKLTEHDSFQSTHFFTLSLNDKLQQYSCFKDQQNKDN